MSEKHFCLIKKHTHTKKYISFPSVFLVSLYTFVLGNRLIQRTWSLCYCFWYCRWRWPVYHSVTQALNLWMSSCAFTSLTVFSRQNCLIVSAAALWCAPGFISTCKRRGVWIRNHLIDVCQLFIGCTKVLVWALWDSSLCIYECVIQYLFIITHCNH